MTGIHRRIGCSAIWLMGVASLGIAVHPCSAQQPAEAGPLDEDRWEVRVYRVTDLILPRPDYPYRSGVPTVDQPLQILGGMGGGGFGGGMGGGGGLGGGGLGGGGFFQISDDPTGQEFGGAVGGLSPFGDTGTSEGGRLRFSLTDLIEAIETTIEPSSWRGMGGEGVCTRLGGLLLVKQTPDVHRQVEALLTAIREEGGTVQAVTLQAYWLLLDSAELARLAPDASDGGRGAAVVDRKLLKELAEAGTGYRGRITCFSDQTVHLVSGRRATAVISGIPTVGQHTVGYTPVIMVPNIGVLLQVRPTVLPDQSAAVVNLETTVTSPAAGEQPISLRSATVPAAGESAPKSTGTDSAQASVLPLDRLSVDAHHLATTIRAPLGEPVLVGGLSQVRRDQPDAAAAQKQLYLVVEVDVAEDPGNRQGNAASPRRPAVKETRRRDGSSAN